jgi:hypothetical protein
VFSRSREWDLDLDHYLNRILPASPLHKFPTPVSRFLGYRRTQRQDVGNVIGAFWSMVGAFCGLAVVAAVFDNTNSIQMHHPPALIASFVGLYLLLGHGNGTDERCVGCVGNLGVQRYPITTRATSQRPSWPYFFRAHRRGNIQTLSVSCRL